ncbi:MAG: 8-amino-7-oxononanoate synthase [Cyanobacteria bacterium J069]|nr:MAG: 8-amino-7-oxononanoate synthase [Cyanobacteria bacterium J069]
MVKEDKFAFVEAFLVGRSQQQTRRSLQSVIPLDSVHVLKRGKSLLNFSANDYLGLSKHPALIAASQDYAQRYGTGATASRLVTGTYDIHQQLEADLAIACGREAALLFNSGFQANVTVLGALLDRHALVLCDRLAHSSLLNGALASRATLVRYRHNDYAHLESLLQQAETQTYSRVVIVSETVFSMDGDRAEVDLLAHLAQTYNAILYLDDAHAIGVLGAGGIGLAMAHPGVDLAIGTLGKAFGAFGAVVVCSARLQQYLINACSGFIYTTALPPAVIGAIAAALKLMPELEGDRQTLASRAADLRTQLQAEGFDTGPSTTHIIPVMLGEAERALHLSQWLESQGILAAAIRPPTVPPGTARLRLALSSQHTAEHLGSLIGILRSGHEQWRGGDRVSRVGV